jgi:TRAP-type C4-dicarboxylate transport system permease small subunit
LKAPAHDGEPRRDDPLLTGAAGRLSFAICSFALVAMIVLIVAEMLARSIFSGSLFVTFEITGYLLVVMTFFSMPVALAANTYHRIEFIQGRLSPRARLIVRLLFDIVSLSFLATVDWQLFRLVMDSWASGAREHTLLATPLWLPQLAMPLGLTLLSLMLLREIVRDVVTLRRRPEAGS